VICERDRDKLGFGALFHVGVPLEGKALVSASFRIQGSSSCSLSQVCGVWRVESGFGGVVNFSGEARQGRGEMDGGRVEGACHRDDVSRFVTMIRAEGEQGESVGAGRRKMRV